MTRSPSRVAIFRELVARGILPESAEIKKSGSSVWQGADFYHVLSLDSSDGTWALWTGDSRFRPLEEAGYGGVKVKIQPKEADPPYWALDPEDRDARVTEAIAFVHGREDLCRLLMSPESVVRGRLEVWQMLGNLPARLAQALMLSRDLGRDDLEEEVRSVLNRAPDTNAFGKQIPAIESARRWLKEYAKVVTTDARL